MLTSFTIALLCGMAFAVDSVDPVDPVDPVDNHIRTKVDFKNIYHMSGATLAPGYGGGEILKAGGQTAWEIKKENDDTDDSDDSDKEFLYIYYTIGVNIDQNYGKNDSDDEESDEEEDPVESPAKARIQVGLCGQEEGKDIPGAEDPY